MAKLPRETAATVWSLKQQLLDIIDNATAAEAILLERFGETDRTISYLDELTSVAEQAASRFSQFSTIQLRIAEAQPTATPDMLKLLSQVVASTQDRLPALERSIQEIKIEWDLP